MHVCKNLLDKQTIFFPNKPSLFLGINQKLPICRTLFIDNVPWKCHCVMEYMDRYSQSWEWSDSSRKTNLLFPKKQWLFFIHEWNSWLGYYPQKHTEMSLAALGSWQRNFQNFKEPINGYPYQLFWWSNSIFLNHQLGFYFRGLIRKLCNVEAWKINMFGETFLTSENWRTEKVRKSKSLQFFLRLKPFVLHKYCSHFVHWDINRR